MMAQCVRDGCDRRLAQNWMDECRVCVGVDLSTSLADIDADTARDSMADVVAGDDSVVDKLP